ncbi:unnamed protein product [Toxocara canis]|uniref:Secreted protein n=1 Tax=Toxocara canis TaxID=6265 RepID=A0A183U5B7_TOXCA|nr:unnamed protein product [Toxocara canis]
MRRLGKCTGFAFGSGLLVSSVLSRIARCEHVAAKFAEVDSSRSRWLISSEINTEGGADEAGQDRNFFVRLVVYLFGTTIWIMRVTIRIITLFIRFAPLTLTYPLVLCSDGTRHLWWRYALWTIETSGPTLVKLGQWASTRRDIFSKDFCDKVFF